MDVEIYDIEYEDDYQYDAPRDDIRVYRLPKCPVCKAAPTYNLDPCPFCGVRLRYPEGK